MNRTLLVCCVALSACNDPNLPPEPMEPVADLKAPYLVSHSPPAGARDVGLVTMISLELSEPVAPASLMLDVEPRPVLAEPQWSGQNEVVSVIASELAPDTTYTVTVRVRDLAGNVIAPHTGFSFTTAAAPRRDPPALLVSTPMAGAVNVPLDVVIALRFSAPMDQGALDVTLDPPVALGAAEWTEGGAQVRFPNADPLKAGTRYTLTADGQSAEGVRLSMPVQIAFDSVSAPDTVVPSVESSAPAANSASVPTSTSISVKFSEGMNRASVEAAFSASPAVACTFAWDAAGERLYCLPAAALSPGTHYEVRVATGAMDLAGNALAQPFVLPFDTAALPDTMAPSFLSSTPASGAVGVEVGASLTLVFSEAMDPATTEPALAVRDWTDFLTAPRAVTGTIAWASGNTTLVFTPSAPFAYGARIIWSIGTGATDAAGNALAAAASGNFRTLRRVQQTLYSVGGLDGTVNHTGAASTSNAALGVGDLGNGDYLRSFLSFDLGLLPANLVRVTAAALYVNQTGTVGTPYDLGSLEAYGVTYGATLTGADFDGAVQTGKVCMRTPTGLGCATGPLRYVLSSSSTPGYKSASALQKVEADWTARSSQGSLSQFRLQLTRADDGDTRQDSTVLAAGEASASTRPYLVVTYEAP